MMLTIAQHELTKLFKTGKIWKLLALCQFILGLIFYWLMQEYLFKQQQLLLENKSPFGITEEVIHPLFAWTALFFFFITPLFATNTLTQERKTHTLELYLTTPIATKDIILGKFMGTLVAEIFLLLPVFIMPLIIILNNRLDFGQFFSGLFGLILLLGTSLSIGIFISSFSKEPLIAALVTFVVLFLFTLIEWIGHFVGPSLQWITEVALLYHCKGFLSGMISSRDIVYYSLISFIFLYGSILRLNREAYFKKKP